MEKLKNMKDSKKKTSSKHVVIEPDYLKDVDSKPVKENSSLGNKLTMDPKKKSMTPDTKTPSPTNDDPDNSYFLHILYSKGEPGEQDHKTEIVKMNNDNKAGEHPKDVAIHKFIMDHPITKIHQKAGYEYHFAIGSPNDDPTRMAELMQMAQKNNKQNVHKAKIWEDLAREVTEDSFSSLQENLSK